MSNRRANSHRAGVAMRERALRLEAARLSDADGARLQIFCASKRSLQCTKFYLGCPIPMQRVRRPPETPAFSAF
jgi:hypothetical protein